MIAHVNIMLQIVALLAGIWVIFYLNEAYKIFGDKIIQRLVWISLFLNLWLLLSFTSKYINTNVLNFYEATKISLGYIIRHPLSTIVFSGAVLALLPVVFELSAYEFLKHYKTFSKKIFVFIVISYLAGIAVYIYDPEADLLEYIDTVLLTSGTLIVYISLILLVFVNRQKKERQHAVAIFAIIYGIVFLPIAAFMFIIPFKLTILSALFIFSNLIPFIWVRRYYAKYFLEKFKPENSRIAIEQITEKYGLTDREHEIMELILQGKSNKDIEAALYISLNTVRNHTHNLYRKLNVNGRGQMVGLILTANRSEEK